MTRPVVVVGAGLAGLACAVELRRCGIEAIIVEASDGVGGRVRTDVVDGFLLDRGFQVMLTAYPELHRQFDVGALELPAFDPGAVVMHRQRPTVVADPFRAPRDLLSTVAAGTVRRIGTPADLIALARLRLRLRSPHPSRLLTGRDRPTSEHLRELGFSNGFIEAFLRPLVGGIQLDPSLTTSSRMFDIIMRMLLDGDAAVPASGMGAVPAQLAARLPEGTIHLGAPVRSVSAGGVRVDSGEVQASRVVVATEGPEAARLLGGREVGSRPVGCVYFASDEAPMDRRLIVLAGDSDGPALNVAVMSNVAPTYAPTGRHLIAAALPGETISSETVEATRRQLRGWWGGRVDSWEVLSTYSIAHGQPDQSTPLHPRRPVRREDGIFVCGDHRDTGSIQGALHSGRRCAEAVAADLAA
ncbi:MAG: NAD(P)/FAD-dependent oxidoreductase [Ilumatobacteraceae bacterium]